MKFYRFDVISFDYETILALYVGYKSRLLGVAVHRWGVRILLINRLLCFHWKKRPY